MFTYVMIVTTLVLVSVFGFGIMLNIVVRRIWATGTLVLLTDLLVVLVAGGQLSWLIWELLATTTLAGLLCTWASGRLRRRGYGPLR